MTPTMINSLYGLQQLCPMQSSIATCLNQLRHAHVSFLNLGNLIVCPELKCFIIFKSKCLIRIESIQANAVL